MRQALRRAFRRVSWAGPPPTLPPHTPVVLYANHHNFYDGYLAWLVIHHMLQRPTLTWMAEWDRYPFFAAVGADQPRLGRFNARFAAAVLIPAFRKNSRRVVCDIMVPVGFGESPRSRRSQPEVSEC